jgi:hypothetical protein
VLALAFKDRSDARRQSDVAGVLSHISKRRRLK